MKTWLTTLGVFLAALTATASTTKEADIAAIEAYLSGLRTFQATFEQFMPGEPISAGKLFLQRPGKLVWRYDQPTPQRLISTDGRLFFEDTETQQITQLPSNGLTRLLTADKVNFAEGGLDVVAHRRDKNGIYLELRLEGTDGDEPGKVGLMFKAEPLELRQLVSRNQLGEDVTVFFHDATANHPIPASVFKFTPPQYQDK